MENMIVIKKIRNYRKDDFEGKEKDLKDNLQGNFSKTCDAFYETEAEKPGLVLAVIGESDSYVPNAWNRSGFIAELTRIVHGVHKTWIFLKGNNGCVNKIIEKNFEPKNNKSILTINISLEKKPATAEDYRWFNRYFSGFLSRLSEQYTPLLTKESTENSAPIVMKVPVLIIAVEGDIYTIHQISCAVNEHIPVLLIKGSGKAVDFIIQYLQGTKKREKKKILKENATLLLGIYVSYEQYDHLKILMKSIAKRSHLVTIYDMECQSDGYMEDVYVKAIIKGWSLKDIKEFRPRVSSSVLQNEKSSKGKTVTMNITEQHGKLDMKLYEIKLTPGSSPLYFYMAYQYIQEYEKNAQNKPEDLQLLLVEAIVAKRTDYVTSLLQHDINLEKCHMTELFRKTLNCVKKCNPKDCRQIHAILDRVDRRSCQDVWTSRDDTPFHDKSGTFQDPNRTRSDVKTSHDTTSDDRSGRISSKLISSVSKLCRKLLNYPGEIKHSSQNKNSRRIKDSSQNKHSRRNTEDQIVDFHVLLAWAVFADRHDLAGIFWTRCKNPLLTAIMTAGILKNMSGMVDNAKDMKLFEDLMSDYRTFENRAIEMLNLLYEEDEQKCMSLMNTEDTIWDVTVSPIECAYDNDMKDIIGHPCVQRFMSRVWYNDAATVWQDWSKAMLPSLSSCKEDGKICCPFIRAWTSPAAMFLIHYVTLLALLFMYSAFLLHIDEGYSIIHIGLNELFIYLWTCHDFVEEYIRSLILTICRNKKRRQSHKRHQLWIFVTSPWNWLTILSYLVIAASLIVRLNVEKELEGIERRLYSFGLFMIYMRFLQSMMVLTYFGPKIIMIGSMLKELLKFSWILLVFIMCFGVLYHANMYPEHRDMWPGHGYEVENWRLWKIISLPYWQIYGELFLDEVRGENNSNESCTFVKAEWESNLKRERCVEYDWTLSVFTAAYMAISNLLLVNIIIALFSHKFALIQEDSDKLWKFWRCSIIGDYSTRFPVPFNLILHFGAYCKRSCCPKVGEGNPKLDKYIAYSSLIPTLMEDEQSEKATKCLYMEKRSKRQ